MAGKLDVKGLIVDARKMGMSDQQIYSELQKTPQFSSITKSAKNELKMNDNQIASQFGLVINVKMPPIRLTAEGKAKVGMQPIKTTAKAPSKTESFIIGAVNDIGGGINQGVSQLKDIASSGLNSVFGTNLDTARYDRVTRETKAVNDQHEKRRADAGKTGLDGWRLAGNVVASIPFAPATSGSLPVVVGKSALTGAGLGGASFAKDSNERLSNVVSGALGGAVGAGVGQKVGEGVVKVARKLTPSTASTQNIDIAINVALKNSSDDSIRGMTVTDLSQPARDGLRNEIKKAIKQGKVVDSKTVERMAIFNDLKAKGVDLKPTGKQATGNPKLWTKETELSKMDGGDALNNRYIQQNDTLINALDNALTSTKGTSTNRLQTGESVLNALNTNNSARQQVIRDLYGVAKNHTGNDLALDPNAIVQNARQSMVDNFINPDKAQASLLAKLKPFMDADNPRAFTLKDEELFVKQINAAISKTTDGETRSALGLVRNALEEEADNALNQFGGTLQGEARNAWQAARGAASQRFKQIKRTPSLKAAIDDVAPDQFFEKFILSKSSAVRDVKELVAEVKNNPEAFNNLRLEILRHIADNAVTKQGQAVSPAGMDRALQSIGDDKLKLFFNPEELKHLKNLNAASRYLYSQPMGSNVNNSNTSSALLNMIGYMDVLKRVPIIGPKLDSVSKGVVNSVNAQIKISQGNNAIGKTATKKLPTAAESSLMDQLRKAGFIGGANLQD